MYTLLGDSQLLGETSRLGHQQTSLHTNKIGSETIYPYVTISAFVWICWVGRPACSKLGVMIKEFHFTYLT